MPLGQVLRNGLIGMWDFGPSQARTVAYELSRRQVNPLMVTSAVRSAATFLPFLKFGGPISLRRVQIDSPTLRALIHRSVATITADVTDRPGKWEPTTGSNTVIGRCRGEEIDLG